jgi:hypothetical protein
MWRILILAGAAAAYLAAQPGQLAGPVSGYVFDRSDRTVRPVLGIPGASLLGDPVSFGVEIAAAYVSPRQDAAVVVAADNSLHIFRLNSGTVAEFTVNGLSGVPVRVAFSPSGAAAALADATGHVQVLTGLPDAPVVAATLDAGSAGLSSSQLAVAARNSRRAASGSLAVSDDGTLLLIAARGSVRLLGAGGNNGKVMDASDRALVAFAPGGHDAAVADPTGAGLILFRDLTGTSLQQVLAAPDGATGSAVGLAFAADGNRVYLANAGGVAVFDLAAGSRIAVACACAPAGLAPMGRLFRLTEPGSEPVWLLDTLGSQPRTVFVPAAPGATAN